AVAVDLLVPDNGGARVLEGAVVLGSTLEVVLGPLGAYRQALELQRGEALIHAGELVRHPPEQALAICVASRGEASPVALVGAVGELAVRTDDPAVVALPVLEGIVGVGDDRVLVRVGELGV